MDKQYEKKNRKKNKKKKFNIHRRIKTVAYAVIENEIIHHIVSEISRRVKCLENLGGK